MELMELDESKPIYYLESVNCHFENSEKSRNNLSSDEFSLDSSIATNNQSNNNKTNSKSLSNTESKSKDSSNAKSSPTKPNANKDSKPAVYKQRIQQYRI